MRLRPRIQVGLSHIKFTISDNQVRRNKIFKNGDVQDERVSDAESKTEISVTIQEE